MLTQTNCTLEHTRKILHRVLRRWWDFQPLWAKGHTWNIRWGVRLEGKWEYIEYSSHTQFWITSSHHRQLQKKLASVAEQEFGSLIHTLLVAVVFFHAYHQAEVSSVNQEKTFKLSNLTSFMCYSVVRIQFCEGGKVTKDRSMLSKHQF